MKTNRSEVGKFINNNLIKNLIGLSRTHGKPKKHRLRREL